MDDEPKSAYEIALEKLKARDRERGERAPAPLSEGQKKAIAEVRAKCRARLAEGEILYRAERGRAPADPEALDKIDAEFAAERRRIEDRCDKEIAAIREGGRRPGRSGKRKGGGRKARCVLLVAGLLALPAGGSAARAALAGAGRAVGGGGEAATTLIAVTAARLLDGSGGPALSDATVILEGDRIRSVGPTATAAIPAAAQRIDLGEATLLPGLIDAHTHLLLQGSATARDIERQLLKESIPYRTIRAVAAARGALENGFTALRDLGTEGAGYADVALRDAIARGHVPGPDLSVATRALLITGALPLAGFAPETPVPTAAQLVDGADAGRRAVREQVRFGADWIKVYCDHEYFIDRRGRLDSRLTFELDELRAIVDEAHRRGRKVAAHAVGPRGVHRALDAGADSIEHGIGLDQRAIRRMASEGVFYCPTLTVTRRLARARARERGALWDRLPEIHRESFESAVAAGVRIALGSDAGGFPWTVNQAEEIVWMARYGMGPGDAIRAATGVAAELLGRGEEIGRLAPGYRADLVAVPGDPLEEIEAVLRVGFVMKGGVVVKNTLAPRGRS